MSMYALTFLLTDKEEVKKLKELVTSSGKLVEEESWGSRRLAYPIKKAASADFYNWMVELEEKDMQELRRKLQLEEKLLRYLLLKVDAKPAAPVKKASSGSKK